MCRSRESEHPRGASRPQPQVAPPLPLLDTLIALEHAGWSMCSNGRTLMLTNHDRGPGRTPWSGLTYWWPVLVQRLRRAPRQVHRTAAEKGLDR